MIAPALGLIPSGPGVAAGAEDLKTPPERQLFLFVDWFHVKKGELRPTLDPRRISEGGRKHLDLLTRDYRKTFEESGHGFRAADVPFGIRIVPEVAERSKPWLLADRPWETGISSATVLYDEGRFRCWYTADLKGEDKKAVADRERVAELGGSALAYAESKDGREWVKPARGDLTYRGSREHNLLSPFGNGGCVFRDDHGPAAERYKVFHFDELPKKDVAPGAAPKDRYGLYGVASPDGYRWARNPKPLVRYFCDTFNVACRDPLLGKYAGFFRHHLSGRTISRAETTDFWDWPDPQPLLYAGPLDSPADDYYTSGYTAYPGDPSLRLLFPAVYHRDSDAVDARLAVSRDGRAFSWASYEPVIRLGPAGAWDAGSLYPHPNLVRLPDGRLALPYLAYDTAHNEAFFQSFYKDYRGKTGVGWALWPDGRLAGIQADQVGQFTTNAARFAGARIEINARTSRAGAVEAELREGGKALDGFSFADGVPFSGDKVWVPLRWKGKDDLTGLRGKRLELCFRLRAAKVFAYRFA